MATIVTHRQFVAHRYAKAAGYRLKCCDVLPNGALVIVAPGVVYHQPHADVLPIVTQLLSEQASR